MGAQMVNCQRLNYYFHKNKFLALRDQGSGDVQKSAGIVAIKRKKRISLT